MSRDADRTWVAVVSPRSRASELGTALRAAGLPHRRLPVASRDLFVVPDRPRAPETFTRSAR